MVFLNLDWRNNAATRDRYEDFARDCCVENTEKRGYIYMQVCMIGNDSRIEVLHADPSMLSPALFTQVELHGPERSREFRRLWMEYSNGSYYPRIRKFLAPRMRKDADFAHALELVLHEYRAERAARLEHCGKATLCAWTWNSNNDVNVYEAMLAQAMRRNFVETNLRDLLAVIISRAPFDKRTWLPVMYQSTTNPDDYVVDDRFSDFTAFCLQIEYAGIKRPRTWHSNITVCGHSLITDPALDNECKHVFCRHVLPKSSCIVHFRSNLATAADECSICCGAHKDWKPLYYPRPVVGRQFSSLTEKSHKAREYRNMVVVQYRQCSLKALSDSLKDHNLLTSKLPTSTMAIPPAAHLVEAVMTWMSPNRHLTRDPTLPEIARALDTWMEEHSIDLAHTKNESPVVTRNKMLQRGMGRIPVCYHCMDMEEDCTAKIDKPVETKRESLRSDRVVVHVAPLEDQLPANRRP